MVREHLQSKLVLITCCKICYNMQTFKNYSILFILIARNREMRKGELRTKGEIERMRGIVSSKDDSIKGGSGFL